MHWKTGLMVLVCFLLLVACGADQFDDPSFAEADTPVVTADEGDTGDESGDEETAVSAFIEFVETHMREDEIPGAAAALIIGDEIVLAQGFGWQDVDRQLPVTEQTLFHIGSTTKSMTAMLAAILVDEGELEWDTPVVEYMPDFELNDSDNTEAVTIRHLLSMTSGIPDEAEEQFDFEAMPAEAVVPVLADVELLGEPEEEYSYSNVSYAVAGYTAVFAADENTDQLYNSYVHLLQSRILDPIGMNDSLLYASAAQSDADYARSYYADGEAAAWYDVDGDSLAPSGVVKATIGDMARYILTQMNEGVAPDGTRVVSAGNLRETWTPLLDNYGLGWQIEAYAGNTVIWHDGSFDEFGSVIGFLPEQQVGFVILSNCIECAETLLNETPQTIAEYFAE